MEYALSPAGPAYASPDPDAAEYGGTAHPVPPRGIYVSVVKPTVDRVFAILGLLFIAPVLLVCVAAVRLSMGRGVIFKQERIGLDGKVFMLYKFRTMRPDRRTTPQPIDGVDRRRNHKDPDDPRLTGVGKFLRRWSLDELPQLWNVVHGNMSLVGPRPEMVDIVGRYEQWQHKRHLVKPGLTGLWQVSARGTLPMHECVRQDLEYVGKMSAALDMKILLRTPVAMMGKCKGH